MKTVRVKSIKKIPRPELVCDVGIEDNHNLFVCDNPNDTPVLAHNCWSILSGEPGVADVFQVGADLRTRYKLVPDPIILDKIDKEGDVHKINAAYFFGIDVTEVTKVIRNAVKTVIFGLIYQQGDKGLAKSTGRTVDEIVDIKDQFLSRFPIGYKWFEKIKNFGKKFLYVESPVGRRRNLWGLGLPRKLEGADKAIASNERRSVNSPVQGFGSDGMMIGIRNIDRLKFQHYLDTGHFPDMDLTVSVHDSVTVAVAYEDFWLAIDFIQRGLTSEVSERLRERYKFELTSQFEVDFEIGPSERDVKEWNFSFTQMQEHVRKALEWQNEELSYDVDIDKAMDTIFDKSYATMPDFMKKQVWANDIKMSSRGKDIRSAEERKQCATYLKELPKNVLAFDKMRADEEAAKESKTEKGEVVRKKRRIVRRRRKAA